MKIIFSQSKLRLVNVGLDVGFELIGVQNRFYVLGKGSEEVFDLD